MSKRLSFVLFDASGTPLIGATPTITSYYKATGEALPSPSVVEIGNGFYDFVVDPVEDGPTAYLIDAGMDSSTRYLTGSVGEFISFCMFNADGDPDSTRNPSFISWDDGTLSPPIQPTINNLGGGLYGFWTTVGPSKLVRYVVGDSDNQYWGTIGSVAITNANPTADTEIANTQAITFDALDTECDLGRVLIAIQYPSLDGATELVWDGQAVCGPFTVTVTVIPNGFQYTILRLGGWPSSPKVRVFVTNFGGREL